MFLKKLSSKKGEGIVTGVLWLGAVAIATGAVAFSIWTGISATADNSKSSSTSAGTTMTTNVTAIKHP